MPRDLRSYGALLIRRWAVVVPTIVLVPLVAVLVAGGQPKAYSANAQVLLTYSNPTAGVNGGGTSYAASAPDRNVATQAALARNPSVAQEALKLAHVGSTPGALLNESTVSTITSADLLNFTVNDSRRSLAMRLATNYARAYTIYRNGIDSQAVKLALTGITLRLARLASAGESRALIYGALSRVQQQLVATQAAGTADAVLVQPAESAAQLGPHPTQNAAAVGLVVGIALAVTLAVLMETLDARASNEEIARRLKLPLLASIPAKRSPQLALESLIARSSQRWSMLEGALARRRGEPQPPVRPPRPERGLDSLALLRSPYGSTARSFRALKSKLDRAGVEHAFKSLLFTSPQPCREQSVTVANLAVAMAQAGRRVLVCDFDGQGDASVTDLLQLRDRAGLAEVVLGHRTIAEAIVEVPGSVLFSVPWTGGDHPQLGDPDARTASRARPVPGGLAVLPAGRQQPQAGLVGLPLVTDLVERLKSASADVVLIAAPPILVSDEARMMSALADAVVLVFPEPVRASAVEEVAVTLADLRALALGFITVGNGKLSGEIDLSGARENATWPARIAEGAAIRNGRDGDAHVPDGVTTTP